MPFILKLIGKNILRIIIQITFFICLLWIIKFKKCIYCQGCAQQIYLINDLDKCSLFFIYCSIL